MQTYRQQCAFYFFTWRLNALFYFYFSGENKNTNNFTAVYGLYLSACFLKNTTIITWGDHFALTTQNTPVCNFININTYSLHNVLETERRPSYRLSAASRHTPIWLGDSRTRATRRPSRGQSQASMLRSGAL